MARECQATTPGDYVELARVFLLARVLARVSSLIAFLRLCARSVYSLPLVGCMGCHCQSAVSSGKIVCMLILVRVSVVLQGPQLVPFRDCRLGAVCALLGSKHVDTHARSR